MTDAGYLVTTQSFQFQTFANLALPILEVVSPGPRTISNSILAYSGSGDVTAPVTTLAFPPAVAAAIFSDFRSGTVDAFMK